MSVTYLYNRDPSRHFKSTTKRSDDGIICENCSHNNVLNCYEYEALKRADDDYIFTERDVKMQKYFADHKEEIQKLLDEQSSDDDTCWD